jgi:hypothetical protein
MSTDKPSRPEALASFIANISEVRRLYGIVRALSGGKRGARAEETEAPKRIFNKSALVLLVACWEAFVEDVALAAFESMLRSAKGPSAYPKKVLAIAAKPLRDSPDERKVWELAGEGWRDVLRAHRAQVHKKLVEPFHSPLTCNVDELIEELVGYRLISSTWHWKGMSQARACKHLDLLVRRRGEIAHRVRTSEPVYQRHVREAIDHVSRLAVITSNRMADFVKSRTGQSPWEQFNYRKVG